MPHVQVLKEHPYVYFSYFVDFILYPTDKYMFKVNKPVFGNCGSSAPTAKTTNLEKAIYFLTLMSCSINKVLLVIHM